MCCQIRTGTSASLQDPPSHLIKLNRFEQGFEIALSEPLIPLPLDELEEDRAELVLGEDLQEQHPGLAVDEDFSLPQLADIFSMARDALVDELVVGVDRVEKLHAPGAHGVDRAWQVARGERDVLDALAVVAVEVFLDLARFFPAFLVDRDADQAAGARHRL